MGKIKELDIIGIQQGLYNVLYECNRKDNDGHRLVHIKCSKCGWETDIRPHQIKFLSQECNHVNNAGQYSKNIGKLKWNNKCLYRVYKSIIQRCYNSNDKDYRWYGAKNVKVCEEWLSNPLSFENWALQNGYKKSLTIDRIDSSKDYCPENCRWITLEENARRASAHYLEIDGEKLSGRQWSEKLSLGITTINKMLKKYPEEQVKEFIRLRLKNKNKQRKYPKQTWMNVYGLE